MIESFRIQNFKSIIDQTIELGRFNVFIGENGGGKTNVLEALAIGSVAVSAPRFEITAELLASAGIRIARSGMMRSAFGAVNDAPITFTWRVDGEPLSAVVTVFDDLGSPELGRAQLEIDDSELRLSKEQKQFLDLLGSFRRSGRHPEPGQPLTPLMLDQTADAHLLQALKHYATLHNPFDRLSPRTSFSLFTPTLTALRGLSAESARRPLGMHGEGLDVHLAQFPEEKLTQIKELAKLITWFDDLEVDENDGKKLQGFKPGRSMSRLYFHDRFMNESERIFSAENANEGILFVLFYLTLFLSEHTPKFFGIDNLDTALNPRLCRELVKTLAKLAHSENKQAVVTTHNPAILDGLNLHDDEQRLFVVQRNDEGHTTIRRIKTKPVVDGITLRLSDLWMRGHLGGIPQTF